MKKKHEPIEIDFTEQIKAGKKESVARVDELKSQKDLVETIATDLNAIRSIVENYSGGQPSEASLVSSSPEETFLDSVKSYIFTTQEEALEMASAIGLRSSHAYKTHDGVVLFMPGRNTGEFYEWYWKTHS
tara:strand:- start:123 stop:515 length:393 start_codon:yes stop_codon:yes gene_type:complete